MDPLSTSSVEFKRPTSSSLKRSVSQELAPERSIKRNRTGSLSDSTPTENCPYQKKFYDLYRSYLDLDKSYCLASNLITLVQRNVLEWNATSVTEIYEVFQKNIGCISENMQKSYEVASQIAALLQNAMLALTFRLNATAKLRTPEERTFIDQINATAKKIFEEDHIERNETPIDFLDEPLPPQSYPSLYFDVVPWENIYLKNYDELHSHIKTIGCACHVSAALVEIAIMPEIDYILVEETLTDSFPFLSSQVGCLDTGPILLASMQALNARTSPYFQAKNHYGLRLVDLISRFSLPKREINSVWDLLIDDIAKQIFSHLISELSFLEDRLVFDPHAKESQICKYALRKISMVSRNWKDLAKAVISDWECTHFKANWLVKEGISPSRAHSFQVPETITCLEVFPKNQLPITQLLPAFKCSKKIERLNLKNYKCTTFNEFIEIVNELPQLTSLLLSPLEMPSTQTITKSFKNVVNLSLISKEKLTAIHLLNFVKLFPNVRYLRLEGWTKLEDSRLISALSALRHLEKLDLTECKLITERGLEEICNEHSAISSLHVGGLSENQRNGMQFLKKLRLKSLGIAQDLTDEEFVAIAENDTKLQELHLHDLSISGQALTQFVKRQPNLLRLELKNCQNVECEHFKDVIKSSPYLVSIHVWDCGRLQNFQVNFLKQQFPHIHIFVKMSSRL